MGATSKGIGYPPKQWASMIYENQFGSEGHSNEDIHNIAFNEGELKRQFVSKFQILTCWLVDFLARITPLLERFQGKLGIKGEKGKLWIPIRNIIRHKRPRPKIIFLENVPRLLNFSC